MKFKAWIAAFRLRTLPLALSCVITGSGIAWQKDSLNWSILGLACLTTVFLQILSNLANDYGDGVKGTDNDSRLGPVRAIQSGIISRNEMRLGIFICALITLASGITLLVLALKVNWTFYVMLTIGFLGIAAAIKYTIGKNAFGYKGLGDLFVFMFFGIVGVLGTSFLQAGSIEWIELLPATSIGFLCTGVLNLNNMRDHKNDRDSGKNTLVVAIGYRSAKVYHGFLTIVPVVLLGLYNLSTVDNYNWTFFAAPLFIVTAALVRISRVTEAQLLDRELKLLALTTFFTSALFILAIAVHW